MSAFRKGHHIHTSKETVAPCQYHRGICATSVYHTSACLDAKVFLHGQGPTKLLRPSGDHDCQPGIFSTWCPCPPPRPSNVSSSKHACLGRRFQTRITDPIPPRRGFLPHRRVYLHKTARLTAALVLGLWRLSHRPATNRGRGGLHAVVFIHYLPQRCAISHAHYVLWQAFLRLIRIR